MVTRTVLDEKGNARKLTLNPDGTYAEVVVTADGGSVASDGELINVDSLAQTLAYNGDGTLNYIQVTSGGNNYRQTYTYTSGKLTAISQWVKQ